MSQEVRVSVVCICYNQDRYIRKTLEGFVMQKTNFKYEVLIHDDASTDDTPKIIKEFEEKYPDIIKPIYQTENQYSKGVKVSATFNYPRAQGEYIAICEGDDWWTDENKLQLQYDFLENNPEYSACVHSATTTDKDLKLLKNTVRLYDCDTDISVEEMIENGGGFLPTNSIFYRKSVRENMPDFMVKGNYGFGDYQLQILLALKGKVRYMDKVMSNYSVGAYGSWTSRKKNDSEFRIKTNALLDVINEYTEKKYQKSVEKITNLNNYYINRQEENYRELIKKEYRPFVKELNFKAKLGVYLRGYFPFIKPIYEKIRKR